MISNSTIPPTSAKPTITSCLHFVLDQYGYLDLYSVGSFKQQYL